jgi:hypothetical protein
MHLHTGTRAISSQPTDMCKRILSAKLAAAFEKESSAVTTPTIGGRPAGTELKSECPRFEGNPARGKHGMR